MQKLNKMAGLKVSIKNFNKVEEDFDKFVGQLRRRTLKKILNKSATPVLRELRKNAPKDEGHLQKSLGKKVRLAKDKKSASVYIGVRRGMKFPSERRKKHGVPLMKMPSKYLHFLEFADSRHRGFMRKSFDSKQKDAKRVFALEYKADLEKIVKKFANKNL